MNQLYLLGALLLTISASAQNTSLNSPCENGSLSIDLNTTDTVRHKTATAYMPIKPSVKSTQFSSNQISVTHTSTVNPYKPGVYKDCYTATDQDGLVVVCCRIVIVGDAPLSTSDHALKTPEFKLYPNPMTGSSIRLSLGRGFNSEPIHCQLTTLQGQTIFERIRQVDTGGEFTIDFGKINLESGVYLITIEQNGFSSSRRLMVNGI